MSHSWQMSYRAVVLPIILGLSLHAVASADLPVVDPEGYLMWCPCMGRFGNQAEHFLGTLSFTRNINRTFVIPPWIEYEHGNPKSIQKPYSTYFDPEALNECHRSITMEEFMEKLAPTVWPMEERMSFCYTARMHNKGKDEPKDCYAKDGNPFRSFWDTHNIDFVGSQYYEGLSIHGGPNMRKEWRKRYPPAKFPVIALTGAPAGFPVDKKDVPLQKYIKYSKSMLEKRDKFIKKFLGNGKFVGIHIRNGQDWMNACERVEETPGNYMASPQCLGYRNEHGSVTKELCYPSMETITEAAKRAILDTGAKYLFIATDAGQIFQDGDVDLKKYLEKALSNVGFRLRRVKIVAPNIDSDRNDNPHLDQAILGKATHFIGNCVSSFTSFVKRDRDANNLPSSFFAFPVGKRRQEL